MVALAIATTKQPLTAKQREARRARKAYIKSATILVEGQRARVTAQGDGNKRYDVVFDGNKATSCTCPARQKWYKGERCKHMEAVDARLALPQLPQGVAKYRKVRGENKLVAVKVVALTTIKEEPTQVKETPKTERRTAKLTQQPARPTGITITDRAEGADGSVSLDVVDDLGRTEWVTLRRTKQHSCTCSKVGCVHIEHCKNVENARYHAAKAEQAKQAIEVATKVAPTAKPVKSEEERMRDAPLNGNRRFNVLR